MVPFFFFFYWQANPNISNSGLQQTQDGLTVAQYKKTFLYISDICCLGLKAAF